MKDTKLCFSKKILYVVVASVFILLSLVILSNLSGQKKTLSSKAAPHAEECCKVGKKCGYNNYCLGSVCNKKGYCVKATSKQISPTIAQKCGTLNDRCCPGSKCGTNLICYIPMNKGDILTVPSTCVWDKKKVCGDITQPCCTNDTCSDSLLECVPASKLENPFWSAISPDFLPYKKVCLKKKCSTNLYSADGLCIEMITPAPTRCPSGTVRMGNICAAE